MCFSITASSAHKVEKEFSLSKGEVYSIGRFDIELDDLRTESNKNYSALIADVNLKKTNNKSELAKLKPELRRYLRNKETTTEVALRMGPREDVYIVLAGTDELGERATFKLYINPLQIWLWIGTLVVLVGVGGILYSRRFKRA